MTPGYDIGIGLSLKMKLGRETIFVFDKSIVFILLPECIKAPVPISSNVDGK